MHYFQYRLISCCVFLLINLAVYAQSDDRCFIGRVVDSETNEPVPFATVRLLALADSTMLVGRVGNPSLKPSYTNTFTVNFNSYNAKHQRNMVATVLIENAINNVINQVTYDSETGVRATMPLNQNGNWHALGSFSLNTPFKNRSWIFRTYSYLHYRNQNGYTTLNKEVPVKSTVKHLTVRQRLQLVYRTRTMETSARA